MSTTEAPSGAGAPAEPVENVDLKLEVVVIPVSDVDRAKAFY
ncbi:MAG: glyoxalase, partial [Solirubrobacterales bacterium]|nr:glyoxalase [Solirubrobacterales bacterium]